MEALYFAVPVTRTLTRIRNQEHVHKDQKSGTRTGVEVRDEEDASVVILHRICREAWTVNPGDVLQPACLLPWPLARRQVTIV
jgi:hypothetical protein